MRFVLEYKNSGQKVRGNSKTRGRVQVQLNSRAELGLWLNVAATLPSLPERVALTVEL
jgi:hypothetical protein